MNWLLVCSDWLKEAKCIWKWVLRKVLVYNSRHFLWHSSVIHFLPYNSELDEAVQPNMSFYFVWEYHTHRHKVEYSQKWLTLLHMKKNTYDSAWMGSLTLEPHPKNLTLLASWGPFGPQSCHGLRKHESITYLATHVTCIRTAIKYQTDNKIING